MSLLFLVLHSSCPLHSQQDNATYTVTGIEPNDVLRVRAGPGSTFEEVGTLVNGTTGIYIDGTPMFNSGGRISNQEPPPNISATKWVPILFPPGKAGWIRPKYLTIAHSAPPIPVPPIPAPVAQTASNTTSAKSSATTVDGFEEPDSYSMALAPEVSSVLDLFEYQVSPQPTRKVNPAFFGTWRHQDGDSSFPLEFRIEKGDELHYQVSITNYKGQWPSNARAWHSDIRGQSFITFEIPRTQESGLPQYAVFQWVMTDSEMKLVQLCARRLKILEKHMAADNWKLPPPEEFKMHFSEWPGPVKSAERFRTTFRRMLELGEKASEFPQGIRYRKKEDSVSSEEAVVLNLEELKQLNDAYFRAATYHRYMDFVQIGWKRGRLSELAQGPWLPVLPPDMKSLVHTALKLDAEVLAACKKSHHFPPYFFNSLRNFSDFRPQSGRDMPPEPGNAMADIGQRILDIEQTGIRIREMKTEAHQRERWANVLGSLHDPRISHFRRAPSLAAPYYQFVSGMNTLDVFPFQNNSYTGPNADLPYPAPRDCKMLGNLEHGPIRINFGPFRKLVAVGANFDAPPRTRIVLQIVCTSGHAGLHQSVDSPGYKMGSDGWADAGTVDPVYQGTVVTKQSPTQTSYVGISHVPLNEWDDGSPTTGYVTIHSEGQDPTKPSRTFKVGESGFFY